MHYVDKEICLNSDRSQVVACDSPQAHFKLTPPFGHLEDEEAVKLGLLKKGKEGAPPPDMTAPAPEPDEPEAEPEEKAVSAAPANKAVAATPDNKAKK